MLEVTSLVVNSIPCVHMLMLAHKHLLSLDVPGLPRLECIQDIETRVDEPDLFLPTADQTLDNLERQGYDMVNNLANLRIQKLDTDLRNKVTFEVDMQPTGSCEFWIRNVDLVRYYL